MKRISIESPYRSNAHYTLAQNVTLARAICRRAVEQGHNPYAMHLFYPQFMDEDNPVERDLAIELGQLWGYQAEEVWFCRRRNEPPSGGMKSSHDYYSHLGNVMRFFIVDPDGYIVQELQEHEFGW
jgi:hypothetical protein